MVTALSFQIRTSPIEQGKMHERDIKSEPTKFIPSTIITAMMIMMIKIICFCLSACSFRVFLIKCDRKSLLYRKQKKS